MCYYLTLTLYNNLFPRNIYDLAKIMYVRMEL